MKSQKKYVDDSVGEGTLVRFNQTLQNYLKVSVRNITYNLTKKDNLYITDPTVSNYANTGGYLLQNWVIKSNDKNNIGKIQNFINITKTTSPTSLSRGTTLSQIGNNLCIL